MSTFWRTFHHDDKISSAWWECRVHPFLSIYHHKQSYCVRFSCVDRYTPPISCLPLYLLCELASPNYFIVPYENGCDLSQLCPQRLIASVLVLLSFAGAEGVEGLICYCNGNFWLGCPSKLASIRNNRNRNSLIGSIFCYFFSLFRNSKFRLFRFCTETESFDVLIESKQTEDPSKQFEREYNWVIFRKLRVVSVCFCLLRNSSVCFTKQTETNPKKILFRFVSVRTEIYFCLFRGHPTSDLAGVA
jgi:hypothetical protein